MVPITSNIATVWPFRTMLPAEQTGIRVDSKAQAEQIRSVSVDRIGNVLRRLPQNLQAELDSAIRLHLALT